MGIAIKERRDWDAACAPSFNLIHPRRKAVGVFRLISFTHGARP